MHRLEALRADLGVLRQMLRGMPQAASHAQNLQEFYATQAAEYDRFRERLLCGRRELIDTLRERLPAQARVVELGGGTGRNLEFFGDTLNDIARFDIVDLCPALLDRAGRRVAEYRHVHMVEADATTFRPDGLVDCVYFSYSLTMIPDWQSAIENALRMLKPGGVLGVVDFYTSEKYPADGLVTHSRMTRAFWPRWFAHDGVHLNGQHLATLRRALPKHALTESRANVPYLPMLKVPYYTFVGQKHV